MFSERNHWISIKTRERGIYKISRDEGRVRGGKVLKNLKAFTLKCLNRESAILCP